GSTGPSIAPVNAGVVRKGLEPLDLRGRQQSANAMEVAKFVERRVPRVLHPGLPSRPQHGLAMKQTDAAGPIFSFFVDGGRERAMAVLTALELIDISNNIGDAKSLMC